MHALPGPAPHAYWHALHPSTHALPRPAPHAYCHALHPCMHCCMQAGMPRGHASAHPVVRSMPACMQTRPHASRRPDLPAPGTRICPMPQSMPTTRPSTAYALGPEHSHPPAPAQQMPRTQTIPPALLGRLRLLKGPRGPTALLVSLRNGLTKGAARWQ
eukprot:361865-Chlamydomonas_euryale.AAC.2